MESSNIRKVKVKTMDGRTTDLEVDPGITIEEFKGEVEAKLNVPKQCQRLIYKTKLLKAEERLSSYITKDDETIHLMAITEEQARTRTEQRASQPTNNARASPQVSSNQQRNIPNQSAPNPLGNVMGLLGNFMQEFNAPGGSSHFSTATLDLSSLFGPPPPVPTNQAAGNTTIHTHQSPHGHIHIQTSTGPIIRERSGPRVQSPAPAPVPTPTSIPAPTQTSAPTEEAKVVENRTQGSNRNQNIIVLPHNHLYNANVINNELMGVNSAFPGPPLPPSGNPRTAITLLGSYLANLQF